MSKRFPLPHVVEHGNGWRYRRVVPLTCQDAIGKANWIKSWPPGTSIEQISRDARALALRHNQEIAVATGDIEAIKIAEIEAKARAILATDSRADIHELIGFNLSQAPLSEAEQVLVNALEHGGTYRRETFSLTEALARDRKLYSGDKDQRPFHYAVQSFVDLVGDKDVTRISRDDVGTWLAGQRREGLAPATIRRRFGTLKALINRALLDLDHPGRNPFDGHKVGGKGSTSDRIPLNKAMLDLLDAYLDSGRAGHETVNILRIMKGTGGGPAEVGGLVVNDVSLGGAIPFVWYRENGQRRLKSAVRDRQVPLIGVALEAAQDAVERAGDRTGLFPGFDMAGRAADSLSAKLNKAIRAAGVPNSRRLTAYSLRHTLAEALRVSGARDDVQRRLLGHATRDISDRYGADRARLEDARDALTAALKCLGDVDPLVYSKAERLD